MDVNLTSSECDKPADIPVSYGPALIRSEEFLMKRNLLLVPLLVLLGLSVVGHASAQDAEDASKRMTLERLGELIAAVDKEFEQPSDTVWRFKVTEFTVTVITDPVNDRMRIVVPIAEEEKLNREILVRMMQANFDSALDARYSIARGILWSAFIHPLGSLTDDEFLSGVGQTVNLVRTFGTTFFSGGLTFGGGDSQGLLEQQLIEELLKKKQEI